MRCFGKVCGGGCGLDWGVGGSFIVFGVVFWTRNDLRQRHENSTCIDFFSLFFPFVKFIPSFLIHQYHRVDGNLGTIYFLKKKKILKKKKGFHFVHRAGNKIVKWPVEKALFSPDGRKEKGGSYERGC